MKPAQKLAEIKKAPIARNSSTKGKISLQRNSPYAPISGVFKPKIRGQQLPEEQVFRPIMVTFVPISSTEIVLKPDYPL